MGTKGQSKFTHCSVSLKSTSSNPMVPSLTCTSLSLGEQLKIVAGPPPLTDEVNLWRMGTQHDHFLKAPGVVCVWRGV